MIGIHLLKSQKWHAQTQVDSNVNQISDSLKVTPSFHPTPKLLMWPSRTVEKVKNLIFDFI